ncbi:UNVERIFIED_CONTAM: ABC transporter B family member 19 [Sesamum radiatum]|uniref:ABC transporter B family member 19 n=1 Tax=Sesamum radiatum TaxID=300843 RepID=A0AAW2VRG8_SESRA
MYTGERQVGALRRKYLEAVLKQDVGFFDTDARTGDIVFSVSTDTLLVQDAISEKVGNFIHYLSTFLAGLVVGFVSAWKLALLSVAVIPGIAFAGGLYAYTLTGLTSKSRESYASAGIIAEQSIAQVRTVYSYVGLGLGCTYGIACMSWALVFWYAGVFIRNGQTDGGKAFTAIFSAIVGGMSLGQSFSNLGAFSKGKAAGYKLMEIIKQKPTIVQDASDGKCLSEVNGNIEFKNVTFSYPSRPDIVIFRDFSIFFPAGKTIAVVGGSGSGKSTVVSLIERFYPNQGEILLDNVDIKTLQLNWLRNQIGLAAANAANAHSFITLLPNGYNTQVGERGVQLSGGQKQRIAIARAMLKDPKILLLDEATSALDAGSESIVQEALDRLMVGRTTVVVAHRLSTIRNVDSIAVLQQGQVVETGTHEELIAKAGAYASLIRFQEMVGNRDLSNPSTRRTRSTRLSHSLSTKSLSLRSGSLRNLSYSYSTGADGRIEMVSNAETDRKNPAPAGYFCRLLKLNAPEWPYSIMGAIGIMGENLTTRVRRMMLAAILRNEVGWFDEEENNSSLLAARLATDAADVKSAIAERISVILQNMTSLLTSFIVAFIVEWRVSLLILATFPLLVLANFAQQLSLKGFAGDTAKAHAKTSMIAGEGVSNIRTVAAFNAQEKILSLFAHELHVPQRRSLRRSLCSGLLFGLSQLALYGSEALILWYGAHLVSVGASTFSKVIKVFVVLVVTANSVAETVSLAPEIVRGGEAVGSVFSILDRPQGLIQTILKPSMLNPFVARLSSVMLILLIHHDRMCRKSQLYLHPAFSTTLLTEKEGATEAEVVEAARAANVHTFVSGLPDGYKTPVGERGVQLSGGQKQRIAIARAILKDPSILLLDEATSALDAESECVLQDALERLMRGRTTVVVAHRLSTIRGVDSIGVVQDGRIVEQGSHGDLISRPDGAYSRLLQLQRHRI